MGSKNNAFVGSEKGFGRSSDECVVGLGLRGQKQVEESCPNRSVMPMPHHHHHHNSSHNQHSSSSSCCVDGFNGGASGGGPIVCNTSNQVACTGDIYDVVGAASVSASASASAAAAAVVLKSLHHHPFSADPSFPHISSGEMAAPFNARSVPFTAAQWQDLERQTMIYKYMVSSLPVPPELLIPLTRNPSNVVKGSLELGFLSNISSDPEPWRCRRTDGKKWRCSRDVAPDQKYCERHSHKSRPRSRKPVELPNHDHKSHKLNMASSDHSINTSTKQPHQNPHFINLQADAQPFTSSFDQPSRCLEWFMKEEATVPLTSNSNPDQWQQFRTQGTKYGGNVVEHDQHRFIDHGLNFEAHDQFKYPSQETRSFIDAWSIAETEVGSRDHVSTNEKQLPISSLTLSMSGGNRNNNQEEDDENRGEMGGFGVMGGLSATENGRALKALAAPQVVDPNLWMGSPPGGPLAEALCLGIASSQSTSTSSCSKRNMMRDPLSSG